MTGDANNCGSGERKGRASFKINAVSELTGISQDVLRVWERRYGAVNPSRTAGGTRLYSDEDVWRFTLLRQGVAKGHLIGRIVKMTNEELEKLRRKSPPLEPSSDPHAAVVESFIEFISEMDFESARSELVSAVERFSPGELIESVFAPILVGIGDHWQHGEFGVAEEHLASNVLRSVLVTINESERHAETTRSIVLATPEGERHELGLMLSAIAAALRKWRVVYLGLETPAEEIARTVRLTASGTVGLSIVGPFNDITHNELAKLDLFLPPETTVIIGGSGAAHYTDLIRTLGWRTAAGFDELNT